MSYLKKLQNIVKLAERSEAAIVAKENYDYVSKLINSTDNKEVTDAIDAGKGYFSRAQLDEIRNYSLAEYTTDTFNPKFALNKDERAMIVIADIKFDLGGLIKDYIKSGELKKDTLSTAFPNKEWLSDEFYSNVKQYLNKQQENWHRKNAEKQNKQKNAEFKELKHIADVGKFKLYYVPGIEDGQFRWNNKQDRSHDRTLIGNKLGLCLGSIMGLYQDNSERKVYALFEGAEPTYCIGILNGSPAELAEMRGTQNTDVKVEDYNILEELSNILKFKFNFDKVSEIKEKGIGSLFALAQHFNEFKRKLEEKDDLESRCLLNPNLINDVNDNAFIYLLKAHQELYLYFNNQSEELSKRLLTDVGIRILKYVKDQTPEICLSAIKKSGNALQYIRNQTEDLCLAAVMKNGLALQYVNEQTTKICLAAVNKYSDAIQFVKQKTPEICLTAVMQDGETLQYIKEEQTPEICMAAITQNISALSHVKEQTPDICLAVVKQNGLMLKNVKEQTPEICLAAVKQNGNALRDVKEQYQSYEVCIAAVSQNYFAFNFIENKTPEICLAAVKENPYVLQLVSQQTPEICIAAVKKEPSLLRVIKEQEQTPEICLAAVRQDGLVLRHVKQQTEEICLAAVTQNGKALRDVEDQYQSYEVCVAAVSQNFAVIREIRNDAVRDDKSIQLLYKKLSKEFAEKKKTKNNNLQYKNKYSSYLLEDITKLANKLDEQALHKEADELDHILIAAYY